MKAEIHDKDKGWAHLLKEVKESEQLRAKVGLVGEAAEEQNGAMSIAEIGAVNEFGTEDKTIPERSFLRSTFDHERASLITMSRRLLERFIDHKITIPDALNALGLKLATEVKKTITGGVLPLNAPYTALRKAMTGKSARFFKPSKQAHNILARNFAQAGVLAAVKPLIDTGRMLGAITWTIVSGDDE